MTRMARYKWLLKHSFKKKILFCSGLGLRDVLITDSNRSTTSTWHSVCRNSHPMQRAVSLTKWARGQHRWNWSFSRLQHTLTGPENDECVIRNRPNGVINFDDATKACQSKSKWELIRALLILKACSIETFTKNSYEVRFMFSTDQLYIFLSSIIYYINAKVVKAIFIDYSFRKVMYLIVRICMFSYI